MKIVRREASNVNQSIQVNQLNRINYALIDGSPATSFERTVEDVSGTFMVKDVPTGKYSIKAKYPNKKLLLDNRHNNGEPKTSKLVMFDKYGLLAETEYNTKFWVSE